MTRPVFRRIAQSIVVLVGVSFLVFMVVHLVPGDPIERAMGTRFDPEVHARLVEAAGFNEPLWEQYVMWAGNALRGDLGDSFLTGQAVSELIRSAVPATLSLALTAWVFALLIAFPAGIVAAVKSGSRFDAVVTSLSQLGLSVPNFWTGLMLVLVFAVWLPWLPSSGYVGVTDDVLGWAEHLVLPAVTIGLIAGAILTRFVRASLLEQLRQPFVWTARSKGLAESTILWRHVLPNAMIPIVTVAGLQLGFLLGGLVVIEIIFAWPGVGRLAFDAVLRRDYPVLQGAVLVMAVSFLLVNLLVDLLYTRLDPRVRA